MFFLDIATTVCIGLLIGNEIAVSAFINPILWKLEGRVQARAVSLFAARLGTAMPFWYALNLVLLIIEAIAGRHEAGSLLLASSCAIWAAVVLLTVLFLAPINNRLARMDSEFLSQPARREHKRWDTLHRARIAALTVSMVCFLIGNHI